MFGEDLWAFVVIGGFVLLAAALAFAKLRNKEAGVDEPVQHKGPPPHFNDKIDPNDDR